MAPTLLLIEDDPGISRLLELYLGRSYGIKHVGSASAAGQALSTSPYDFVLLDVMLPDQPGWHLMTKLRAEHPDTKVVVMTGRTDGETLDRAYSLGARSVLRKPISPTEIKSAIEALR